MKKNLFIIFSIVFILSSTNSRAQFANDIQGRPVFETRYENLSGSPFSEKSFLRGSILRSTAVKVSNVFLQYDQIKDILIVKMDSNATPIELTEVLNEFKIFRNSKDTIVFRSYKFPNEKLGYAQVICNGKFQLIKRIEKRIVETQVYNSANINKSITSVVNYYVVNPLLKTIVVKDKKSFIIAFNNKNSEITDFISKQKTNFKDEKELIKLVNYYNSLID